MEPHKPFNGNYNFECLFSTLLCSPFQLRALPLPPVIFWAGRTLAFFHFHDFGDIALLNYICQRPSQFNKD